MLFGLNHRILPKTVDPVSLKANVDSQIGRICFTNKIDLSYDSRERIRESTDKFVHEAEQACNTSRNKFVHRTLSNLSKNKELKVCKMDKGNGVVLMNKSDYFDKLDLIVNDTSRFELIDYDINTKHTAHFKNAPWIKKENTVINFCSTHLKKMMEKDLVDEHTYKRIYPKGSQPGKLYGTAKNHKANCPLRPVLSAVNTPEYALAKWLEKKLKPYLNDQHSVDSSAEFVNELRRTKPNPAGVYVSFDIKSLYTNVPLNEVIEDIACTVYEETAASSFFTDSGISKRILKNVLKTCSESIFLYNDKVYKQRDGVAMGSPLAPLLANWFVAKIEERLLTDPEHSSYRPSLYKRYVDDIFATFESIEKRDKFFEALNVAHPNLSFTMEEPTSSLPFLDVSVSINDAAYRTAVYRKPTNTRVIMHYSSMVPLKWKRALVKCFLTRSHKVSSDYDSFATELETIKKTFLDNGYPTTFTQSIVDEFIESNNIAKENFKPATYAKGTKDGPIDETLTAYFTVPYFGRASSKIQICVKNELREHGVKVVSSYNTTSTGSYFNLKSSCSKFFKSNVVYKFTCSRDQRVSYIGETTRQLFKRIQEHKGSDKKSAVFDHLLNCRYCQNFSSVFDLFSILNSCRRNNIFSFEALLIKKFKPSLNTQLGPGKGTKTSLALY